jgi:hypothetical protein
MTKKDEFLIDEQGNVRWVVIKINVFFDIELTWFRSNF